MCCRTLVPCRGSALRPRTSRRMSINFLQHGKIGRRTQKSSPGGFDLSHSGTAAQPLDASTRRSHLLRVSLWHRHTYLARKSHREPTKVPHHSFRACKLCKQSALTLHVLLYAKVPCAHTHTHTQKKSTSRQDPQMETAVPAGMQQAENQPAAAQKTACPVER